MSLWVYLEMEIDTGGKEPYTIDLYDCNITHNLIKMADAACLYAPIWTPAVIGIEVASQLEPALMRGLNFLINDPVKYKEYEAVNGCGTYSGFVGSVSDYLAACKKHPKSTVRVSK